jgi:hypothetical protein
MKLSQIEQQNQSRKNKREVEPDDRVPAAAAAASNPSQTASVRQ